MDTREKVIGHMIGRSVLRLEDARFLLGQGRFVADIDVAGQLWGHVLRSPHAHAVIRGIDATAARALPGVNGVFTAADLAADGLGLMPCTAAVKPMIVPPRTALATGRARHVGDPVAFIVADSVEIARDAAELIEIDYEPLPAVIGGAVALGAGAPQIWDEVPGNLAFHHHRGDHAAVAEAMKQAVHIVEVAPLNNRVIVAPVEPRAGIGSYDAARDQYTFCTVTQGVNLIRAQLSVVLGVGEEKIDIVAKDVGGGFGVRSNIQPEYPVLLLASKLLGHPVKWTSTRSEAFLSDEQGRDVHTSGEAAVDERGRILALRFDDIFHGLPFALVMALFGASVIASATLRWPVKARNAGFFICHVGLMTSLAGAAALK